MKRVLMLSAVFVLLVSAAGSAQTTLCIKLPFQASAHVDPALTGDFFRTTATITLPATPIEIEQLTIRVGNDAVGDSISLYGAGVSVTLYGQTVVHGIELKDVSGYPQLVSSGPGRSADLLRQVKFFADSSSQLGFDFSAANGAAVSDTAHISVTVVGHLVTPTCWIGAQ